MVSLDALRRALGTFTPDERRRWSRTGRRTPTRRT